MADDITFLTVQEMAYQTGLTESEVTSLVEAGYVMSVGRWRGEDQVRIPSDQSGKLLQLKGSPRLRRLALVFGGSFMYEYHPELSDYLLFHDTIDILCWMVKLRYASQDMMKRKAYRLDRLFDAFVAELRPSVVRLRQLRGKSYSEERVAFHLNKGWYNELVRAYPLNAEMLEVGTNTNGSYSRGRSVAWNIVQSYYAIYEFVNSMVFSNTATLRTEEHRKSTRHFNKCLLGKFSGLLVPYPFNLTSPLTQDINILRGQAKKYWQYQYASCPRDRRKSLYDLERDYLALISEEGTPLDFLYAFRVWANYLGIDTIISLQDGYYLSYLYKNLGLLCFFYGCFAELLAIAVLGESQTVALLANIATNYVLEQDNFRANWFYIPSFLRFRVYRKYGIVESNMDFLTPDVVDPIDI